MRVGLFFGSFNPIHTGHLIIANYMVEFTKLDQVWFVVSPQNPFKQKSSLLNEYDRLHLVRLAVEDNIYLEACSIEFELERPSYTINTLVFLKEMHPDIEFSILMGSDNLQYFHKWKNHEQILQNHQIFVYLRKDYSKTEIDTHPNIHLLEVPLIDISATFIRQHLAKGKSMRYFLPDVVFRYIEEMNLYKNA